MVVESGIPRNIRARVPCSHELEVVRHAGGEDTRRSKNIKIKQLPLRAPQ
jgi:hypothetical protein